MSWVDWVTDSSSGLVLSVDITLNHVALNMGTSNSHYDLRVDIPNSINHDNVAELMPKFRIGNPG